MKRVIIESPYKGDIERNVTYARACAYDCIKRDEAPFASHLFYTQPGILDDDMPEERMKGIRAGQVWGEVADLIAVYVDYGITEGMKLSIEYYKRLGIPIEERRLYNHT